MKPAIVAWMGAHGIAIGHGDTPKDLLDTLAAQLEEWACKRERDAVVRYLRQPEAADVPAAKLAEEIEHGDHIAVREETT